MKTIYLGEKIETEMRKEKEMEFFEQLDLGSKHLCELLDMDHDLGDYAADGGDGVKLLDWLEDRCAWTDEKGKCLIYNILNNINERIQPVQKIDITDYFDYFLKNVPIQSKEEK